LFPQGQLPEESSGIVGAMNGLHEPPGAAIEAGPQALQGDDVVGPSRARDILASIGWLALQPEEFQDEVFKRAAPVKFRAGEVIYRLGDPLGGVFGFVSGAVLVTMAPAHATPQPLHVMTPGGWTGEGCFLSRQPRRIGLQAAIDTTAIYLPLDAMDQMAGRDPMATRRFTQIMIMNLDIVLRAYYDLQDSDEHRRIARALRRVAALENMPIPLTQAAIGILSNTSRKTVNAALRRFAKSGWVTAAYRSITITNLKGLGDFADHTND
jgi:CRP/FNR family transcriptional regulator, cyclic AMP receptor protein